MELGDFSGVLDEFFSGSVSKVVLSAPLDDAACPRICVRRVPNGYQAERIIGKQAFHENMDASGLRMFAERMFGHSYGQLNGWNDRMELCASVGAGGGIRCKRKRLGAGAPAAESSHNREKRYLLSDAAAVPALVDMGVFTSDGRLVPAMADKYRQINRFLEYIEDVIGEGYGDKTFHAIDFGCGKSYLTFVVYHYLTYVKKMDVRMTGLDLKADVIRHCNEAARKYGYDGLSFQVGDISGYETGEPVDMVVTLHACDTATDHALAHAVKWGAKAILSVPCCQHELNGQMHFDAFPIFQRYGIVQERLAALMTDSIRANLLTACGYKTQILEFVDLSHTPKNLLIRAVKARQPDEIRRRALSEARSLISACGFRPTLARLLGMPCADAEGAAVENEQKLEEQP